MNIFDRDTIEEAKQLPNGTDFLFEYVAAYVCYQDAGVVYEGALFYEADSRYKDSKTGQALECFYRYDENDEFWLLVKNLDGSFEIK